MGVGGLEYNKGYVWGGWELSKGCVIEGMRGGSEGRDMCGGVGAKEGRERLKGSGRECCEVPGGNNNNNDDITIPQILKKNPTPNRHFTSIPSHLARGRPPCPPSLPR